MNNSVIYLSSAYLAPIQYYQKLISSPQVVIEQYDHYMKQTYRNRCYIIGAEGVQALTIPTLKPSQAKCLMRDIQISDHGNWQHLHWNALKSAYSNTPYYEFYEEYFAPFYEKCPTKYLLDFNESLQALILDLINTSANYSYSTAYKKSFLPNEQDLREVIHPKQNNLDLDPTFISRPYFQVFQDKHGFIPNLSIIDLLFSKGPESIFYLSYSLLEE